MKNDRTPTLDLPLPHPDNDLEQDVVRLRDAFAVLDERAAADSAAYSALSHAQDLLAEALAANMAQTTHQIATLISPAVAPDKTWSSERIAAEIGYGSETSYHYNSVGELVGMVETLPGGLRTTAFTYSTERNLSSMVETYAGVTRTTTYHYAGSVLTGITTEEI